MVAEKFKRRVYVKSKMAKYNGYMSHRRLLPTLRNDLPKVKQYERCG
jgi:hypothetical protein